MLINPKIATLQEEKSQKEEWEMRGGDLMQYRQSFRTFEKDKKVIFYT